MPNQPYRRTSPIWVRKAKGWRGDTVWTWDCTEHKRARGYHRTDRWSDRWRRGAGLPPDRHPWARAQDGALRHWHTHHSGLCKCPAHPGETFTNAKNGHTQ